MVWFYWPTRYYEATRQHNKDCTERFQDLGEDRTRTNWKGTVNRGLQRLWVASQRQWPSMSECGRVRSHGRAMMSSWSKCELSDGRRTFVSMTYRWHQWSHSTSSPVTTEMGHHLPVYYRPRPTHPGHPSVSGHNKYWRWPSPLLGKKRRVLYNSSRPCYQNCRYCW